MGRLVLWVFILIIINPFTFNVLSNAWAQRKAKQENEEDSNTELGHINAEVIRS